MATETASQVELSELRDVELQFREYAKSDPDLQLQVVFDAWRISEYSIGLPQSDVPNDTFGIPAARRPTVDSLRLLSVRAGRVLQKWYATVSWPKAAWLHQEDVHAWLGFVVFATDGEANQSLAYTQWRGERGNGVCTIDNFTAVCRVTLERFLLTTALPGQDGSMPLPTSANWMCVKDIASNNGVDYEKLRRRLVRIRDSTALSGGDRPWRELDRSPGDSGARYLYNASDARIVAAVLGLRE